MKLMDAFAARILRATTLVDSGYRLFERVRSATVVRLASNGTLDSYNDLAYAQTTHFTPGMAGFRVRLFDWERDATARHFPAPPARLLVGGAGGGREALAWAGLGYEVVAFEPSRPLAQAMAAAGAELAVRSLVGRYEDLPRLATIDSGVALDVGSLGPFGAAVFGMGSFSHLRGRQTRVAALRQMGALTGGPVLLSFYVHLRLPGGSGTRLGRIGRALGFRHAGDGFSPDIGFYHWSTQDEIESEVAEAGLEILEGSYSDDGQWPWIAARRRHSAVAH